MTTAMDCASNSSRLAERQIELLEQELFLPQTRALEELESREVITPAVKTVLYGELKL